LLTIFSPALLNSARCRNGRSRDELMARLKT
jgi:hypothetical protein